MLLLTSHKQRTKSHFRNYHFSISGSIFFPGKSFSACEDLQVTAVKHSWNMFLWMKSMEAGPKNSLDKQQALLVWSSWVCGTGIAFYILWPRTAAFSKQSTIIRSDKRANTVHSGVKKKHIPLLLSSPFIQHPYVALFSLTFSHFPLHPLVISLLLFFSFLFSHQSWGTCIENSVSLFALGMETDLYLYTILQPQLHFCREHNRRLYYVSIQHTFSMIEVLLLITPTELQRGGWAHCHTRSSGVQCATKAAMVMVREGVLTFV